jgi:hypothetical protein
MPHTRLWSTYEAKPAGGDNANQGDDEIRATKVDLRERFAVDHQMNVDQTVDGRHTKVTLKTAAAPTQIADYAIVYAKDVAAKAELHVIDEDGDAIQMTSGGKMGSATTDILGATIDAATAYTIGGVSVLSIVYPVGIVLTFGVATNPADASMLGFGTWTAITGKVIVGKAAAGTFNTLNAEGGAETVTLDATMIPAHTHTIAAALSASGGGAGELEGTYSNAHVIVEPATSSSIGGGLAHANLQPYIVKYVWERTA